MTDILKLPNGVRIAFERVPNVRSAAVGIWVGVGSRFEKAGENGSSHFIEHMLFKGTETRTASEIAAVMDGIGGQINAFTTKETTCFYGRVLDAHLTTALDVLCDMFFGSRFSDEDMDNERSVIFEEISMYEDTPDDLVSERLSSAVFKGPLGRPILGSPRTLKALDGAALRAFMRRNYLAQRTVVSLCGSFEQRHLDYLAERFSAMERGPEARQAQAVYKPAFTVKRKAIGQNHLCLGFPGLPVGDPDRYAMQLLISVLGGGMSSRLFQKVREERGLCYSVYTFGSGYRETGLTGVYVALGKETESEALKLIVDELRKICTSRVTGEELDRAREQIKANVLMGLESTAARMNNIGRSMIYLDRVPDSEEIIGHYDAVTADEVLALARSCFHLDRLAFSAVGRVENAEHYAELLKP